MKIRPPETAIPLDDPFQNALFGRKAVAVALCNLLERADENLVIFLSAPWGQGKSTFAKMWLKFLLQREHQAIYYDAFKGDYFEDPFLSFSGEILRLVENQLSAKDAVVERKEIKKNAIKIGKRLGGLAIKIGLRAATLNAIDASHIEELKAIGDEVAGGVSEAGADAVETIIENYAKEGDALTEFKKSLTGLAKAIKEKQEFPLVIVVDELDRCRPDFALALLERIKHLFDVPGVAFLLLVNKEQIERYVCKVYGEDVDPSGYLMKFGDLFLELPTQEVNSHTEDGRVIYANGLLSHYGLPDLVKDASFLMRSIRSLIIHFQPSLREIEKSFTTLVLFYSSAPKKEDNTFLTVLLAILKTKEPDIYQKLARQQMDFQSFMTFTRLDSMKNDGNGLDDDWILKTFRVLLMSDTELETVSKSEGKEVDPWSYSRLEMLYGGKNRRRHIPFLCEGLDRFSVAPK